MTTTDDLSEDFHSASRCGNEGPACPGCVLDKVRAELDKAKRDRSAERSMWSDAALALLLQAKSVILKASRAHCADDPWRTEASRWVQHHAAFTGDEDELVPHVETANPATTAEPAQS